MNKGFYIFFIDVLLVAVEWVYMITRQMLQLEP